MFKTFIIESSQSKYKQMLYEIFFKCTICFYRNENESLKYECS